jgi:hypothetical protein
MDNQMQRTYKPAERLFFNDSNANLEFFYRDIPYLSQIEREQIKKEVVVSSILLIKHISRIGWRMVNLLSMHQGIQFLATLRPPT